MLHKYASVVESALVQIKACRLRGTRLEKIKMTDFHSLKLISKCRLQSGVIQCRINEVTSIRYDFCWISYNEVNLEI